MLEQLKEFQIYVKAVILCGNGTVEQILSTKMYVFTQNTTVLMDVQMVHVKVQKPPHLKLSS